MKKNMLLLAALLLSLSVYSQENRYLETMQSTIAAMDSASIQDDFLKCASQFERIAAAEKTEWIPYYYGAYSLIMLSFNITEGTLKDQVLDRAQDMIDKAMELAPDESELHVLQAFLYPARILVDPVARGMEYVEKNFMTLKKARELNPDNPRVDFLEGMNRLNMPPSFGGGPDIARPLFESAEAKFKAFQNPDPLWPDWGEETNRMELEKLREGN